MKENDIRPQIYDCGENEAILEDIKRLASQKNNFVTVDCPACGLNNFICLFKKYGFNFATCKKCGTVFMNPRATPEILNHFYANSATYKYWNKNIFPASEKTRKENIVKPRIERILDICKKYSIPTNCLMEVGAGFGTFCEVANETGKFNHVIAVEPAKDLAESCRLRNVETIESPIERVKPLENKPNIIVSFEVIEHLFSPRDFLLNCKKLMAQNSIIVVTCPNYKGFDISTLGLVSESIDAEHINLFNPESLKNLFNTCGFKVLESFTPGELDADIVRNKIIEGKYNIDAQPFLKTILIDKWDELGKSFQKFLQNNQLSSHMWTVAMKIE
jgi:2-polyprenyl-3-methyl-5-hydroxy-6-metoxy-1,4-benzoquinol methylase/ribosomal protein S27E